MSPAEERNTCALQGAQPSATSPAAHRIADGRMRFSLRPTMRGGRGSGKAIGGSERNGYFFSPTAGGVVRGQKTRGDRVKRRVAAAAFPVPLGGSGRGHRP